MNPPYTRIGIIREGKQPADKRVALPPALCRELLDRHPHIDLAVQRSPTRAFTDDEYAALGITLVDDLHDRELIIGVKEVPVDMLIPGKSYLFFSHTIKKQPHNQRMLQAILERKITLIDHELLTDRDGSRVLAFGRWAGVVGAYNALRAWQLTHGSVSLKPAHACHDRKEMMEHAVEFAVPRDLRIVLTGGGRVGGGAMEVLDAIGIRRVAAADFLSGQFDGPVYTVLGSSELYARNDGQSFDRVAFHNDPSGHHGIFLPYARKAQMYFACHFWDPRGPKILSRNDLRDPELSLQVIADISCDVGGPIDSTLHATTIASPFYGYDRLAHAEVAAGTPGSITVMAVDNLPCELPRDASTAFGRDLLDLVIPELLGGDEHGMIARATIVRDGELTRPFHQLKEYAMTPA